jgi:hypothetical protein
MMSEMEKRLEEIAQAMQDSYGSDIALLERRDKAAQARIAKMRPLLEEIERQGFETESGMLKNHYAFLELKRLVGYEDNL